MLLTVFYSVKVLNVEEPLPASVNTLLLPVLLFCQLHRYFAWTPKVLLLAGREDEGKLGF